MILPLMTNPADVNWRVSRIKAQYLWIDQDYALL
jgi:hypothetical protein